MNNRIKVQLEFGTKTLQDVLRFIEQQDYSQGQQCAFCKKTYLTNTLIRSLSTSATSAQVKRQMVYTAYALNGEAIISSKPGETCRASKLALEILSFERGNREHAHSSYKRLMQNNCSFHEFCKLLEKEQPTTEYFDYFDFNEFELDQIEQLTAQFEYDQKACSFGVARANRGLHQRNQTIPEELALERHFDANEDSFMKLKDMKGKTHKVNVYRDASGEIRFRAA